MSSGRFGAQPHIQHIQSRPKANSPAHGGRPRRFLRKLASPPSPRTRAVSLSTRRARCGSTHRGLADAGSCSHLSCLDAISPCKGRPQGPIWPRIFGLQKPFDGPQTEQGKIQTHRIDRIDGAQRRPSIPPPLSNRWPTRVNRPQLSPHVGRVYVEAGCATQRARCPSTSPNPHPEFEGRTIQRKPHVESLGGRTFRRIGDVLLGSGTPRQLLGHERFNETTSRRRRHDTREASGRLPPRHHRLLQRSIASEAIPPAPARTPWHPLTWKVRCTNPSNTFKSDSSWSIDKTSRRVVHAFHQTHPSFSRWTPGFPRPRMPRKRRPLRRLSGRSEYRCGMDRGSWGMKSGTSYRSAFSSKNSFTSSGAMPQKSD